jgi:hypothetical protein
MDGTRDHRVKCNKPDSERQVLHAFSHNLNLKKLKSYVNKVKEEGEGKGIGRRSAEREGG